MENLDLIHYLILFAVSILAGYIDAIVGGGGMLTLPSLIACGMPPHAALATNKFLAIFGSGTATIRFASQGLIDFKAVWLGMVCAASGGVCGTWTILLLSPQVLHYIIPALLIAIFFYTIFSPKLGDEAKVAKFNSNVFYTFFGFLMGFYDGFFGPATGSLWIFALVIFQGYTLKNASATTKAVNFASNFASFAVWALNSQVVWLVGGLMGLGQVFGAVLGSNAVLHHGATFIRRLFLCVVIASIAKLVWGWFE